MFNYFLGWTDMNWNKYFQSFDSLSGCRLNIMLYFSNCLPVSALFWGYYSPTDTPLHQIVHNTTTSWCRASISHTPGTHHPLASIWRSNTRVMMLKMMNPFGSLPVRMFGLFWWGFDKRCLFRQRKKILNYIKVILCVV